MNNIPVTVSEREAAELANWKFSHEWYVGLELIHAGVNIGAILTYDVLQLTGKIWKQELEKANNAE